MLLETISQYVPLTNTDKEDILAAFTKLEVPKKHILLQENNYARELIFIEKGLVRSFYINNDGTEKTHWIYYDDNFATAWYSFFLDKPSFESLEAISECTIYTMPRSKYDKLYANNAAFNGFINYYYQQMTSEMDYLMKSFNHMNAKEKYQSLLESNPYLLQNVKLGYIASLLGISQETLSRVRRTL